MRTHSFLVINPRSGRGSVSAEEVAQAARELGVEAHVLRDGEDPGELARASGAEILGVAGGDGSLAEVAQAAIELEAAVVCIPCGTRNHFAHDVGLDRRDPLGALEAFAGGAERRIDVGLVAGRLFLNNVSFGAYAGLVHERESPSVRAPASTRACSSSGPQPAGSRRPGRSRSASASASSCRAEGFRPRSTASP